MTDNQQRHKCRELERVDAELRMVKRQLEVERAINKKLVKILLGAGVSQGIIDGVIGEAGGKE